MFQPIDSACPAQLESNLQNPVPSHYKLFCVILGRLEVGEPVISAKLATFFFISLVHKHITYDGLDTGALVQERCPFCFRIINSTLGKSGGHCV